jgi:hypothetical protein
MMPTTREIVGFDGGEFNRSAKSLNEALATASKERHR